MFQKDGENHQGIIRDDHSQTVVAEMAARGKENQIMITNVHFVSFSPCGGTEKVATALGRDITLSKLSHNITLPESRAEDLHFDGDDLVFLAFPVYGGHMPRHFTSVVSCLHGNNTPLVMVAVHGHRA